MVCIEESPNRKVKQIATLIELEQNSGSGKKNMDTVLFAAPVNQKLSWLIVDKVPPEFTQDKFRDKNPSHRYYMVEY